MWSERENEGKHLTQRGMKEEKKKKDWGGQRLIRGNSPWPEKRKREEMKKTK